MEGRTIYGLHMLQLLIILKLNRDSSCNTSTWMKILEIWG